MQQNKTTIDVAHIATLANLPLTEDQKNKFTTQLTSVLEYMAKIQSIDTKGVIETSQVTGLTNIFRDDEIDVSRTFSQETALKNAKRSYRGFFVVSAVFN